MNTLIEKGIIKEIEYDNNLGYVVNDSEAFSSTDYQILQNQNDDIFIRCMKMKYNGMIELYYVTEGYRTMQMECKGALSDKIITIVINLIDSIAIVKENGFLQPQHVDISWQRIYVNPNTLEIKLIYLPLSTKIYDDYAEFEYDLKIQLVKFINENSVNRNDRIDNIVKDLMDASMTIIDIVNKYKHRINTNLYEKNNTMSTAMGGFSNRNLKIISSDNVHTFAAEIIKAVTVIGKKRDIVDIAIEYNNMISRKHCSIISKNGLYFIRDEGSANGTYINGRKISPGMEEEIKSGDRIRLANSDFIIQ